MARPVRLHLRSYLGARLGPLAVLLLVLVCLSAPIAFYVLGRRALQVQARATARQVAEVIRREAVLRPLLWQYDTPKLLGQVRTYEVHERIERIDVVDGNGELIDRSQTLSREELAGKPLVWQSAPVTVGAVQAGAVWVAVSTTELRREAVLLLVAFGAMGLVLAGLMYWLPMRSMGRAQEQIGGLLDRLGESQGALESLNENLEGQVEKRSSQLRRALHDLQEKEQNLRALSMRSVGIQEEERRAIARELHDSAGQSLTAIRIHLQLMADLLSSTGDEPRGKAAELATRTTGMVDETVEEIRRAVNQLGPAVLDDVGLRQAIERAADDLSDATGVEVECEFDLPAHLEAAVETTCYRVVQESLTNVARHAAADRVEISVTAKDGRLTVRISDDGRGFDSTGRNSKSRGLIGMRERFELLGGRLDIESVEGQGTRIVALLPLSGSAGP